MAEENFLKQLTSLFEMDQIDAVIEVLKENTGKGKIIDSTNTTKMESIWGFFVNYLFQKGKLEDSLKVSRQMFETLLKLQEQDNARYHKGASLYNIGNGLLAQAFHYFLYSFIEDTINQKRFPEGLPSVSTLQGIFKVDSEFIQTLSNNILEKMPDTRDPREVIAKLKVGTVPVELWRLEYAMQEIEIKLRRFIENKLSSNPEWWEKLIPENTRKSVEEKIDTSSEALWFSEQPISPLDYLSFPREYIQIITDDNCWKHFESAFKHKAVIKGKLSGLGQIRHKIAHYRKISERERQMFEETVQWLVDRLK